MLLLIIAPKSMLMSLRILMPLYRNEWQELAAFLKTADRLGTFHRIGDVSFKQLLNNFARYGDSSGLIFLRTILGILPGPDFLRVKGFNKFSRAIMKILLWRWLPLSSNFELETVFEPKNFALSLEENDASGTVCFNEHNRSAFLHNWVADLSELSEPNIFVFNLVCILYIRFNCSIPKIIREEFECAFN